MSKGGGDRTKDVLCGSWRLSGQAGRQGTSAKLICPCLGRDRLQWQRRTGPPEAAALMDGHASIGALP